MKYTIHNYFFLFVCISLHSMQQVPCKFNNTVIDEQSIVHLATPAPELIEKYTQEWLIKNPHIVDAALGYEAFIGPMKPFHEKTNTELEKQGIKNISPYNYVFELPQTEYFVKIAGHCNRKYNVMVLSQYLQYPDNPFDAAHYDYNRQLTDQDYNLFLWKLTSNGQDYMIKKVDSPNPVTIDLPRWFYIENAPKTYQTISRVAHYLLFLEAKKRFELLSVTAPEMHLVHVPGRPEEVSDRNYIVLEKKCKNLKPVENIMQQEVQEVEKIVGSTGLFNITKENVFRSNDDDQLVFVDFEQPNNSNPQHFFHKAPDRFVNNMNAGFNSFRANFLATKQ